MSTTPLREPPTQGVSTSSGQMLSARMMQPMPDPSVSKRVCFYKSGDNKFSGHRMFITARTFKTFDALLDALSQKVPLPFGVRTITTPRGTHLVKGLDELQDGGSYVCSDQRRVKPLNLIEVNRQQVPWNTNRAFGTGRQRRKVLQIGQIGKGNEVMGRPAKVMERVAVRTPKRLVVIKNRDPTIKRTIVLHRRTAPTFDSLLDYLSQILQFPVLKIYSTDGRRVDGLAALILCSGFIVAAGTEPFRLANYSFHRTGQTAQAMYLDNMEQSMLHPQAQNTKSFSSGRGSRNFSLSSERYIVNQINKSLSSQDHCHNGPFEVQQCQTSMETCGTARLDHDRHNCVVPQDEDIEKSFRVNQDGSMTVEMKVRLTIKEEEMLHWTTTLSRSSLSKRTVCASIAESGNSSPDSNLHCAKDSSSVNEDESKEENHPSCTDKSVIFNDEGVHQGYTSRALGKTSFRRVPTPGPRHVKKKTSIGSVKMVTESGVHENTLGHYSYVERTPDGETTEGYCMMRHSSSSSNRPVPKPRKTGSTGASNKGSRASITSLGVAEVLQIENNGMEVTETVMHIYESQGYYDNYFANEEYSADGGPSQESKPSTNSGPSPSSNDCDIDFSRQPPTADSLQRLKEEMLSLSSEPISPTQQVTNNLSSVSENEARKSQFSKRDNGDTGVTMKPARKQHSSPSTVTSVTKQKGSMERVSKHSKNSSSDKLSSNTSTGKKSLSESGQKSKVTDQPQMKTVIRGDKEPVVLARRKNRAAAGESDHNVNTSTGRPQMKKNISDILRPPKSPFQSKRTSRKPKSSSENRPSLKKPLELSESVSMPSLKPSPLEIHQYVENWLEDVSPDPVPYMEEATDASESQTRVVFQIGADSDSEGKNGNQTNPEECYPSPGDTLKASASCLSIPLCKEGPGTSLLLSEQNARGLCVSMPSVRVEPAHQENRIRSHKSAEIIQPVENESSSFTSSFLSPKAKLKPAFQQLCSSIQSLTTVSSNMSTGLESSNSRPDFSSQVTSVFGSSCKAFLSFLSVMTLRDSLTSPGDDTESTDTSEAMLFMESLQKISAMEDQEEQRASLTDLQNRASSQFRKRWEDFQILRERLESEPLSPSFSETEFALDVVSEGGDAFEHMAVDELMEELDVPPELRAEISTSIQQARSFYPVEESTSVETAVNHSETDLEHSMKESDADIKQVGSDDTFAMENITETKQENNEDFSLPGEMDDTNITVDYEEAKMTTESLQDPDEKESEVSLTDRDESLKDEDDKGGGKEVEVEEDEKRMKIGGYAKETDDDIGVREREEYPEEEALMETEKESEEESVEKEEEEMIVHEEEEERGNIEEVEKDLIEETGDGLIVEEDKEGREDSSVEETDTREGEEESEEEEEEADVEKDEEGSITEGQDGDTTTNDEEDDAVIEATDEEAENIMEDIEEEEDVEEERVEEETGELTEVDEGEHNTEEGEEDEEGEGQDEEDEVEEKVEEEKESEQEEDGAVVALKESIMTDEEEEKGEAEVMVERDQEDEGDDNEEEEKGEAEVTVEKNGEDREDNEEEEKGEAEDMVERDQEDEEDDNEEEEKGEAEVTVERDQEDEEDDNEEEEKGEAEDMVERDREDEEDDNEGQEKGESDQDIEESEKTDECDEEELEKSQTSLELESAEETKEGIEMDKSIEEGQTLAEVESEGDEDDESHKESRREVEGENASEDGGGFPDGSCDDENYREANTDTKETEPSAEYSSEGHCEDDKGNGTDTVNETDEAGDQHEDSLPHPVEISQELLDFVNSALQSSSLIFTFDDRGNIRLEPDNARVCQTKQTLIPKRMKDCSYGFKQLNSPSTSDLSDYRPETSESGGYKTQESVDIVSESGEEDSERPCPIYRHSVHRPNSKVSPSNSVTLQSSQLKSVKSFSSSGTNASKEDLSYFSAAGSSKADPVTEAPLCLSTPSEQNSNDGVLIDQGRWLLKENHLIRKSPPVPHGMYGNLDSTSVDTSEDSPSHKIQHNPLAAISSSELEEMAKPQTVKCTYYNMPHGSDSDPFLDDTSVTSGKRDTISFKGRGFRVSPTIDTSKNWANKNGSLSSFASVEFKLPDSKVHPEGESAVVSQARRTSSVGGRVLQPQDSLDTLHVRCGQYCPIL